MASLKYDLPLLDRDTRFSLWQVKMRAVLSQADLDDALEGFGKKDVKAWTDEEKRKDRKALSHIHLHLSNNILQEVLAEKTAAALWLKLESICMSKDLTSKMHMKMKLFTHRLQEGGSVLNHVASFKEIVADLQSMEKEKMKQMVRSEESTSNGEALATRGREEQRSSKPGNRGKSQGERGRSKSKNRNKMFCKYCKKTNHWIEDCWKVQNKEKRNGNTRFKKSEDDGKASVASSENSDNGDNGGLLRMGDNTPCEVIGIGSVKIGTHDGMTRTPTDVRHVPNMFRNLISLSTLDNKGYRKEGIVRHHTIPHTPQQNGVTERMNRTIVSKARCMLSNASMGRQFWAEAANTACHLINRSPSNAIDKKTPMESVCEVENLDEGDHVTHDDIGTQDTHILDDDSPAVVHSPVLRSTQPMAVDRPARVRKPVRRLIEECNVGFALSCAEEIDCCAEPSTYTEAMISGDREKWMFAMQEEMQSLEKNGTWDIVRLPAGKKAVRCKWIFKRREGSSPSETTRYKARLVAKGFSQIPGIDYNDVFSPVVKHSSIRALFGIVAMHNLELEQLDVKTAFLHGDLEEEIYMDQSEGFIVPDLSYAMSLVSRYMANPGKEHWNAVKWILSQSAIHLTKDQMFHERTKHIDVKYHYVREVIAEGRLKQRPSSWDTAGLLAQLQEEMSEEDKRRDFRGPEFTPVKSTSKPAYPLPPPPQLDKFRPAPVDDRRSVDTKTPSADDRWTALKNYRRARGLCQRCAEKWSRDHKCADAVQLHAVQEVLELFSISDESDPPSLASTDGCIFRFEFCLFGVTLGTLYDIPVHILIDSGSSHTFISTKIASQLSPMIVSAPEMKVQVASGHNLLCSSLIPAACWQVQTCSFIQDLRILDLSGYDMIVGLDWLEQFSPMEVHWKQKWLRIPYQGKLVRLCGLLPAIPEGSLLQIQVISASSSTSQSAVISPQVQALLDEYQHLFELPVDLPPTRECDHSIPLLPGASPVSVRPYRFPPALKDEIEKQVHEMLSNWLIHKSTSPFSSSVLLVKKKDNSWRFCVNYRQLNAITVKSKYPVPIIEELLDELHGSSWFSKLDLRSGFHQIRMSPGEEYKTAFQTHIGQFEFRVMPFGLTDAPRTFQSAMNSTLAPFLRKFVLVFFDDILIYSKTFADHLNHLKLDSWQIKLSKCEFAQRQIHYLGHVISQDGVSTNPAKIEAIISWPSPSSVKELRSFLGLAGYYRRFVRHFGVFSRPLTALLKKHALFIWTTEHDASFAALKQALCKAPVLALPDFIQPFLLETDASGSGVGAVLMQGGHPLAYVSKALGPKSQGLSTYEKEYLAILMAVQHWRQYLGHTEFIISTDQKSLLQLSEQRLHTHWQQKVFSKLLGLNYKIVYKQGTENRAADALSRKPSHTASCAAITTVSPHWLDEVLQGYTADTHAQDLIAKLLLDPMAVSSFSLSAGLLRYKGRIWIGNNPSLQTRLLQACHDSAVGGHSGFPVTYSRIKQLFAWQGLKKAVRAYAQSCLIFQKAKPDRARLPGLLQPLPVLDTAWQVISMDFVEGLPLSGRADCILVVVDCFTKYAHLCHFTILLQRQVLLSSSCTMCTASMDYQLQ
ncbi:hypothetical protein U9M48_018276 [Paspalum notatum var. saurae]|uniref:Gag-Pol-p199 n=1 Tax=Paspalum notatum var. saurae TaxID=547442 RepID=A0AAQ3TCI5_PASNO